jgi:cation:H+ antiporter
VAGTRIGAMSPILLLGYLLAIRAVFRYERRHDQVTDDNILASRYAHLSLRSAVLRYTAAAAVLVVAAANVPGLAVALADATGLAQSFVGTALVAASTSLPEVVVSIAAVRLGAWDLAAANVLGSNLFNVAILTLDDLAYRDDALLAAASPSHAVTALGAAAMSVLVIITLIAKPAPLTGRVTWAFLAMCAVYTLVTVLAF